MQRIAAAALVGVLLGFLGARVIFVNSAWSLAPWGLVGLAIGVVVVGAGRGRVAAAGAAYGFALAYVFMLAAYDGDAARTTRLLPFLAFGVFGAGCGAVLTLVGAAIRSRR